MCDLYQQGKTPVPWNTNRREPVIDRQHADFHLHTCEYYIQKGCRSTAHRLLKHVDVSIQAKFIQSWAWNNRTKEEIFINDIKKSNTKTGRCTKTVTRPHVAHSSQQLFIGVLDRKKKKKERACHLWVISYQLNKAIDESKMSFHHMVLSWIKTWIWWKRGSETERWRPCSSSHPPVMLPAGLSRTAESSRTSLKPGCIR